MRSVLLFLAGLLVGANLVYFLMVHPRLPATPGSAATTAATPVQEKDAAAPDSRAHLPTEVASAAARPAPATGAKPDPATALPSPNEAPTPVGTAAAPLPSGSGLIIPVRGVAASELDDTFNDARGSSRTHEALDIMAARGTPVVAAVDGTVEKLFTSKAGGLTIYEFNRERTRAYYYAHLDRYADGLAEGDTLRRGQVIGYVGSTGNASPEAPHLHFAIFVLGPEKRWWKGTAIDPFPLLANRAGSASR